MQATQETTASRRTSSAFTLEDRGALLAAGVGSVLATVCAWATPPDGPSVGQATAADVRDYVQANSSALHLAAAAGVAIAVSFVVVAACLSALVRRRLPGSVLAELTLASGLMLALLFLLDTAAQTMPLLLPGLVGTDLSKIEDAVVVGWYGITGYTHLLGDLQMAFIALAFVAVPLAALRTGLINRWLCRIGLLLAGSAALGTVGIVLGIELLYPLWFAGIIGFFFALIVLATSCLTTWRRVRRTTA